MTHCLIPIYKTCLCPAGQFAFISLTSTDRELAATFLDQQEQQMMYHELATAHRLFICSTVVVAHVSHLLGYDGGPHALNPTVRQVSGMLPPACPVHV